MKKILLSVTAAVALSGTAMAGGDLAPVPVAPADSWSGPYVGAQAGYIWGDADVTILTPGGGTYRVNGLHPDGFMGGSSPATTGVSGTTGLPGSKLD